MEGRYISHALWNICVNHRSVIVCHNLCSSVIFFICFHLILEEHKPVPSESNKLKGPYVSSVYNVPKQTCQVLAGPSFGAYIESQP